MVLEKDVFVLFTRCRIKYLHADVFMPAIDAEDIKYGAFLELTLQQIKKFSSILILHKKNVKYGSTVLLCSIFAIPCKS